MTAADKIIQFNKNLQYKGTLPDGFAVLNPFKNNPETMRVMKDFYYKYYDDNRSRRFIIGINPGRHGAGITGVPFTDTKRLETVCGIKMETAYSHEPSSVFVYELIERYGGAVKFFGDFYINSPFPLAITRKTDNGKWLNANYYDDKGLMSMTESFMIESLKKHIAVGLETKEVFVLGKKNADCISRLNHQEKLFGKITVLEHPRYIQQYRLKQKDAYIDKFMSAFARG